MKDIKTTIFFLIFIVLAITADEQQPVVEQTIEQQVVTEVGAMIQGNIDIVESNQKIHLIQTTQLLSKYLFVRVITSNPIRMSIGVYQNSTQKLVYSCEDTTLDSCYIPASYLKEKTIYAVLIVSNDNMKYTLYSYWGDLEHIKPNQQIKFMFDKLNPTQLFHLQFNQQTKYEQIRIVLKPEASRQSNDNLKIFANRGLNQQPTQQKHDYKSIRIWRDAQAIFLLKQELIGQIGISLYVVGNAETVYVLQCQFLQQAAHALKMEETLDEFLPRGSQTYYQMNFNENNNNVDSFVIKIAVFTGELEVGFYYDKQFQRLYEKLPYQYMSDMQFNFLRSDFQLNTKQIFMRIRCIDSPGIYQITTQARNKELAFEIPENVYEFSTFSQPQQAMYFFSHIWDEGQYQQSKRYRFDISIIKIYGSPQFQFYMCNPEVTDSQCKKINDANYFTKFVTRIKPIGQQQVGLKLLHTLQFTESVYKKLNVVEKKLMVIILAKNSPDGTSAYAVEFSNPNKIRLLREGRSFEDKVRSKQKKYYKYLNSNPTVSEIRIHVNEISGLTKIRAKRQDIFIKGNQIAMQKQLPDTIVIKNRVTDPIYLEIQGIVTSLYTISVSALHSQHVVSNALVMAQDIEYEVKLSPYQQMNVQLHPIESDIVLQYYSQGGPVAVCQVTYNNICQKNAQFGSHGQIKIKMSQKREIRFKIGNVKNKQMLEQDIKRTQIQTLSTRLTQLVRKVKLTLIYHSGQFEHCDSKKINKVYSENVKYGSCFKFHLPLSENIEIMLSRSDLGQNLQNFFICSKKVQPAEINNRFVIKGEVIQEICKNMPNDMTLQIVVEEDLSFSQKQIKMDYAVQYSGDIITLTDGVAYMAKGYSIADTALRTFFYEIIDETRDINIVLFNKKGNQKFFGLITTKWEKYLDVVSQSNANFSSRNSNYYGNPYIQIKGNTIGKAKCGSSCVLIISVYSQQKQGNQIQYALELTQNHIYLSQNEIKKGFLAKGSVEFYEYQCRLANESLIFQVSDNNRKCAKAIMSRSPFPTESNFLIKQNEGTIIYPNTQKQTVYFAVEAIQDCPYSVTASEESVNITKIEHGQFYDIKLEQGQQKWFFHRHFSKKPFKVISLQKHGEINIFVNQTELNKTTLENLKKNRMDTQQFAFKSLSKNTLIIDETSKDFCSGCYYLICIQATKLTEGSIMIGSENTKIFLTENKVLFDEIPTKNSITSASLFRFTEGNIELKVHSGKINLQISYKNEKIEKQLSMNRKPYQQKYNFIRDQFQSKPIQIKITALQIPALYSFELTSSANSPSLNYRINPGEHTYLYLTQGQIKCLSGTLMSKQEEIFISSHASKKQSLSNLNISIKLNDKDVDKYRSELVNNILLIRLEPQAQPKLKAQKYSICLKTSSPDESISLLAFQNKNINLIHSDTQVLVHRANRFVLYPNTDIILDLFQCKGNAQIYYGPNLQTIRSKQSGKLNIIGIPGQSHAIKIQSYSALYLDIVARMATVLWMPINETQERGIGYSKYAIGGLEYNSKYNVIDFKIGGVYKNTNTVTKPKLIKYTLFISNSKQLLQQAVMCERIPKDKFIYATINVGSVGSNPWNNHIISIDKKRITDKFSSNQTLYFNVVADMTLLVPSMGDDEQNTEHYRFIYYQQVVPSVVFRQSKIQSINLILLIILTIVGIIGFILISCTFVKYIIPALARLKNRVLVEEKDDPRDRSLPIPPVSERNQVPAVPSSTDQQLQK